MTAIDILLATYNGARFLPEQLRSLEEQTFGDWQLVVRDDGSTDGSLAVVAEWAARTGRPVRILEDGSKCLGAMANFGALLEASDAPYFALCDQDDVWLPEKLSLMLKRLQEAEARCGEDTPLLAYSDLQVVDEDLRDIHPSFRTFSALITPAPEKALQNIMVRNVVTGCASLGNASLRRMALPIPREAIMHDWWLALAAAAKGGLIDLPDATVLYRQHGKNALGAVKWSPTSMIGSALTSPGASLRRVRASLDRSQKQALAFHGKFGLEVTSDIMDVIGRYATLNGERIWNRKKFAFNQLLWDRSSFWNAMLLAAI
jgi:glycosyltransferase involved in cell wall biosynthesis